MKKKKTKRKNWVKNEREEEGGEKMSERRRNYHEIRNVYVYMKEAE